MATGEAVAKKRELEPWVSGRRVPVYFPLEEERKQSSKGILLSLRETDRSGIGTKEYYLSATYSTSSLLLHPVQLAIKFSVCCAELLDEAETINFSSDGHRRAPVAAPPAAAPTASQQRRGDARAPPGRRPRPSPQRLLRHE